VNRGHVAQLSGAIVEGGGRGESPI
jgi:hypothetical protein